MCVYGDVWCAEPGFCPLRYGLVGTTAGRSGRSGRRSRVLIEREEHFYETVLEVLANMPDADGTAPTLGGSPLPFCSL